MNRPKKECKEIDKAYHILRMGNGELLDASFHDGSDGFVVLREEEGQ